MIRMLIVDDETATRNGLLRHLDWKALGVDMIQTAGSGQEALDMCQDFVPDLVLSDIRMRGMDGVQMCQRLRDQYPACSIIFISGYSDKVYLKAAIALGAVEYVEKPVDRNELRQAVRKAMVRILETRQHKTQNRQLSQSAEYLRSEAFFSLLRAEAWQEDPEKYAKKCAWFQGAFPCMRMCILHCAENVTNLSRFKAALWETAGLNAFLEGTVYGEFWDNRRCFLLFCGHEKAIADDSPVMQALGTVAAGKIEGIALFLALGEIVADPRQLYLSHQSAHEAEKNLFYLGYGHCAREQKKEAPLTLQADYAALFQQALKNTDEARALRILTDLEEVLRQGRATASPLTQVLYFSLLRELDGAFLRLYPEKQQKLVENRASAAQLLVSVDTLTALTAYLQAQVRELFSQVKRDESNHAVVHKVTRLLQQGYGNRTLSVKQLATEVYLTPTYLSGLFKRKTGKTIGAYLTELRTEQAQVLLRDPRLKLYQVAEAVGYEDANYFAKTFKKQTGMTPSEYREKHLL